MNFRAGFVSLIGKPNVGKSTLMNALLGEKLSITTPKPQTTRHRIKGIYNNEKYQIVFMDTPGFLKPRYALQEKMLEYLQNSIKDSDLIIFITDITSFPSDYDEELCKKIAKLPTPKIALLNKIDKADLKILPEKEKLIARYNFDKIIPISALNMNSGSELLQIISEFLPYNPPFYSPDEISDLPMRFFVQEIVREQIFLNYEDEIPFSSTAVVEQYKEYENKDEIEVNIWIERKSQKPIILGKNGERIKKVRINAEKEIYKVTGKRAKLSLWIKVKPKWRKKTNALKEFGYR
jgi:GTP-binding protein Era